MRAKQRVSQTQKEKPKTVQKRLRPELPEMWKTFLQKEEERIYPLLGGNVGLQKVVELEIRNIWIRLIFLKNLQLIVRQIKDNTRGV